MTENKYQEVSDSIKRLKQLFEHSHICTLGKDDPKFFSNIIRFEHPVLGTVILIDDQLTFKN